MRRAAIMLALIPLAACAHRPVARGIGIVESVPQPTGWRAIASEEDRHRIDALPQTWAQALDAVPRSARAKLAGEGRLVDPAAALDLPAPPPGPYRCRLLRFGGRAGYRTFPPDFCYVDGDARGLSFTKQTGSNLPGGWLHGDPAQRQIFLGSLPKPGVSGVPRYGDDPAQDVAGVVERVSPMRWRLVLTRAGRAATLDLYELVPVTPEVPGAKPAVPARER